MFAVWIWQLNNSAGDGKSGEIEEKSAKMLHSDFE